MNMEDFNLLYKDVISENFDENVRTAAESYAYLDSSTAKYHGKTIYSLYMAKIFPESVVDYLRAASETMYGILIKVMNEFLASEDYRRLFGFEPELEKMILMPPGYDNILPIARLDIFLNERDLSFKFCEFNADGCSSMNEDRELNIAARLTAAYRKLSQSYTLDSFELFDSWAKSFKNIYSSYKNAVKNPHVAVVDFLEKGCSIEEFTEFRNAFRRAGFEADIYEIRDLKFDGNSLYSPDGKRIDAVYRRAVTSDIFDNLGEVDDFMEAVKKEKVCLVGSFCTQIIHNKILFYLLHLPRTAQFLTDSENAFIKEHIPYTVKLCDAEISANNVLEEKDRWIIKPEDSYGANGVFAGVKFTPAQWAEHISVFKHKKYILQEFVLPYRSYNIDMHKENPEFFQYSNLTGMFMYDGKLAGIYSRQSAHEIISTEYDENDIASMIVKNL